MTDKPTTPDGAKFDDTEDVEGHKVGHPGGKPLEARDESSSDGYKQRVASDEDGLGPIDARLKQ